MDRDKVEDLKQKVKREREEANANINDTLYGPLTENDKAEGAGEFDA